MSSRTLLSFPVVLRDRRPTLAQASCSCGQQASSLLATASAGRMPAGPTAWKAVPHLLGTALAILLTSLAADGKSIVEADKSGFHLFNPTPTDLLRELSTDRPDKTESPLTVDAGHWQIEMDLANLTYDSTNGVRTRTWNIAPVNIKLGLLNHVDVQVIFDSYFHERTTETKSGVGDLTTRLKINLWGNDDGATAFAIMPFVKAPTNSHNLGNDSFQGGVILPLAVKLPGGWSMGLMTEVDFLRDEEERGYHADFVNSVTFSHDIVGDLAGYAEFFTAVSTEEHASWVGTVDVGFTYGLTENVQLDAGCNFGVTRAADNFNPFIGFSVRF